MTWSNKLNKIMNVQVIGSALALAVVVGIGIWGYTIYSAHAEQKAHAAFADCINEYEQAFSGQEPWAKVERLAQLGYDNHSRSHMAPYFLALQAEALIHQSKYADAHSVFATLMSKLSSSSPLYGVYAIKYALLCLDACDTAKCATDNTMQKQGLALLQKIAYDTNITVRDQALYYLGLYYNTHNAPDKARETWTAAVELLNNGQMAGSPWATLAQEKLHYV